MAGLTFGLDGVEWLIVARARWDGVLVVVVSLGREHFAALLRALACHLGFKYKLNHLMSGVLGFWGVWNKRFVFYL